MIAVGKKTLHVLGKEPKKKISAQSKLQKYFIVWNVFKINNKDSEQLISCWEQ